MASRCVSSVLAQKDKQKLTQERISSREGFFLFPHWTSILNLSLGFFVECN